MEGEAEGTAPTQLPDWGGGHIHQLQDYKWFLRAKPGCDLWGPVQSEWEGGVFVQKWLNLKRVTAEQKTELWPF